MYRNRSVGVKRGRTHPIGPIRPLIRKLAFLLPQSVNGGTAPITMTPPTTPSLTGLTRLSTKELQGFWPQWFDGPLPKRLRHGLLVRMLAARIQEQQHGGLSVATKKKLRQLVNAGVAAPMPKVVKAPRLSPGTQVIREWGNELHQVTVETTGFVYRGQRYRSLSEIARRITGTRWSGPVFFGVKPTVRRSLSRGEENG